MSLQLQFHFNLHYLRLGPEYHPPRTDCGGNSILEVVEEEEKEEVVVEVEKQEDYMFLRLMPQL